MLRRPPTAITLTTEDLIKYDETRAQHLAQQRARAAAVVENARATSQQQQNKSPVSKKGIPAKRRAADRVMGSGSVTSGGR